MYFALLLLFTSYLIQSSSRVKSVHVVLCSVIIMACNVIIPLLICFHSSSRYVAVIVTPHLTVLWKCNCLNYDVVFVTQVSHSFEPFQGLPQPRDNLFNNECLFQKDNAAFQRDAEKGERTELSVVQTQTNNSSSQAGPSKCRPEVCRKSRQKYQPPELTGSPWHLKKTIFLLSIIVLLVIWIVVFSTLSQYKLVWYILSQEQRARVF